MNMMENEIRELLERVKNGETGTDEACELLKELPYKDLGFANVDNHRAIRTGFPEVIYSRGKKPEQIRDIMAVTDDAHASAMNRSVAVVTAGTADIPVAEEAAVTAHLMGNDVKRIYDVGVAGIHRLFSRLEDIRSADVIIVIAGMEGALASVVGGLVESPVIAVPTSIGYGANLGGVSALLSMLNSCANGVGVVNIDNGFGAAYLASVINRSAGR